MSKLEQMVLLAPLDLKYKSCHGFRLTLPSPCGNSIPTVTWKFAKTPLTAIDLTHLT